jgi:GNAT superfamily N-acetyltransferase
VDEELSALATEAALEDERQFVLTLGGYALEIPGATLVTHEKIPVPRFNFVQEMGVGPERQAAFFERALDHYFQRALRPTFRVPMPVPEHVEAGLLRLGFQPHDEPLVLMLEVGPGDRPRSKDVGVRIAERADLDTIASFWTGPGERAEFRTALDIAWNHPNPHERLVPLLATIEREPVASALVYRYRSSAGIHAVATTPAARGRGAASELVAFARASDPVGPGVRYSIFSDSARLERRLESLGFRRARAFQQYILPTDAALQVPSAGPPGPPRWRPPRAGSGRTDP